MDFSNIVIIVSLVRNQHLLFPRSERVKITGRHLDTNKHKRPRAVSEKEKWRSNNVSAIIKGVFVFNLFIFYNVIWMYFRILFSSFNRSLCQSVIDMNPPYSVLFLLLAMIFFISFDGTNCF